MKKVEEGEGGEDQYSRWYGNSALIDVNRLFTAAR